MVRFTFDSSQWDKVFNEYLSFQKKLPADVANSKCYFIARQATRTTKATDRSKPREELEGPARDYPNVPLGAIIVNKELKAKGEKGLYGDELAKAVEKKIRKRNSSIGFLRSGWLPAIRILFYFINRNKDRSFTQRYEPPMNKSIKQYGKDKGTAIYARSDRSRVFAQIENYIQGTHTEAAVKDELVKGLDESIKKEMASMQQYIERKMNPEHSKLNR